MSLVMGFYACSDDDMDEVSPSKPVVETVDYTEPTDDQLKVLVTADMPTAVLSTFDSNSVGASLLSRLTKSAVVCTSSITDDTKFVLMKGSDVSDLFTVENVRKMSRIYMNGGLIAIETPTDDDALKFVLGLSIGLAAFSSDQMVDNFELTEEEANSYAAQSAEVERLNTRLANLRNIAATRGGETAGGSIAEMMIFGPTEYFFQEPFDAQLKADTYSEDMEGNILETKEVTSSISRNGFHNGELADGVADWLNDVEKVRQEQRADAARTRAASDAVNELMEASETFTFNGKISLRTASNKLNTLNNRVQMTLRSWGVHAMSTNKDFYYVKQNVTLSLGDRVSNGKTYGFYYSRPEDIWIDAKNYGDYNCWYGAFLSKYDTSMELKGNGGNILLEAAKPETENSNTSVSVNIGQSSSTSETYGATWGVNLGFKGMEPTGGFDLKGSYSEGKSQGSSFAVNTAKSYKDLGVVKNQMGNKVNWTYKGNLPKFRIEHRDGYIWYMHGTAPEILVNDADLQNEICWSVSNPTGQYSIDITSYPQTAALLFQYKEDKTEKNPSNKYEYTNTTKNNTFSHELLQPNRFLQKWRMNISIDLWENGVVSGATNELETFLKENFGDIYRSTFTVCDKTEESLQVISSNINYAKYVFDKNLDILKERAADLGIKCFTIHWRCDNRNIQTKEGYMVRTDEVKFTATDGTDSPEIDPEQGSYKNMVDSKSFSRWLVYQKDMRDGVWFIEFEANSIIFPKSYTLTTGYDTASYPDRNPKAWRLLGKLNKEDDWALLDEKRIPDDPDDPMYKHRLYPRNAMNHTWFIDAGRCRFFRFEVMENYGSDLMQLDEIKINE